MCFMALDVLDCVRAMTFCHRVAISKNIVYTFFILGLDFVLRLECRIISYANVDKCPVCRVYCQFCAYFKDTFKLKICFPLT